MFLSPLIKTSRRFLDSKEAPLLPILTTIAANGVDAGLLLTGVLILLQTCTEGEAAAASCTARLVGWPAAEEVTHPVTTLVSHTNKVLLLWKYFWCLINFITKYCFDEQKLKSS